MQLNALNIYANKQQFYMQLNEYEISKKQRKKC